METIAVSSSGLAWSLNVSETEIAQISGGLGFKIVGAPAFSSSLVPA
jgi:hypothetical protein